MHAAKGLFEEYGPDGVTFSQIADAADVCRTTVYSEMLYNNVVHAESIVRLFRSDKDCFIFLFFLNDVSICIS